MSDFLSSLRANANRLINGNQDTQRIRERNAVVRQGSDYRNVARSFSGSPMPATPMSDDPVLDAIRTGRAEQLFASDLEDSRGPGGMLRDTALDVATGVAGGALDLLSIGASGLTAPGRMSQRALGTKVYADPGILISQGAQNTREFLGGLRTTDIRDSMDAYAVTQDVAAEENRALEQERIAAGGSELVSGAQRFGRDVADSFSNLTSQQQALTSITNQGVGSLLLGGPTAKAASSVVTNVSKGLAAQGLLAPRVANLVAESVEAAAMTGTIAAMEAGGAYGQASSQVMSMTHEDLLDGSPRYAELINSGVSRAEARNQIATQAGTIAASLQSLVSAPTGRLVAGFEAAPLAGNTVRGALRNIGAETVEEGVQSFSGEVNSNFGIQFTADKNLDLIEGVGQSLVEGAVAGAGTGAAFAAPSVAIGSVQRGAKAVQNLISKTQDSGKRINEANILTPEETAATISQVSKPSTAEPVTPDDTVDPVADAAEFEQYSERVSALGNSFTFDRENYQPASETEARVVASLDQEAEQDVWDVIQAASTMMKDQDTSPDQQLELAIMIAELRAQVSPEALADANALQGEVAPGGTIAKELERMFNAQAAIENNPLVREAYSLVSESLPDVSLEAVQDISTPEGQKAAKQVAITAEVAPEKLRPEVVSRVLEHSTNSPQLFTPNQLSALRTTVALTSTVQALEADAQRMGVNMTPLAEVANQAQLYELKDSGKTGKSVRGHAETIRQMINRGDQAGLAEAVESFRNFAQSAANKLAAINEGHESRVNTVNKPATYDAYSQSRGWYKDSVKVISQNLGSVTFAQQAIVDSRVVVDSFNNLIQQFPEIKAQPVTRVEPNADLIAGPAKQVIAETFQRDRGEIQPRTAATQATPAPAPTPAPEVETKAEQAPEPKADPVQEPMNSEERLYDREKIKTGSNKQIVDEIERLENRAIFGEPLSTDAANLKALRAERDSREDALITEPSVVVEDTATATPAPMKEEKEEWRPDTWNGILVNLADFDDLKIGEFNVKKVPNNPVMKTFAYIAVNGTKIAGSYEFNPNEDWIEDLIITSDRGEGSFGNTQLRSLFRNLLKEEPKAIGLSGIRQTGARFRNDDGNVELNFRIKDGRLIPITFNSEGKAVEAVEEVTQPEAQPEPQTTDVEASEQVTENVTPKIEEVFPDLIKDENGDQLLLDGFTLDNESRTRLIGNNTITIEQLAASLADGNAFKELTGLASSKISPPVTEAYGKIFGAIETKIMPKSYERMKASKIYAPYLNGKNPIKNVMRRASLKMLNVLRIEDGKPSYDPTIEKAMILALADWLAQASVSNNERDEESIARKLGINVASVDGDLLLAYNKGVSTQQAHESLAQTLSKFLGLKAKKNVKNGFTDGLMLSLANEMLRSATEAGIIIAEPITVEEQRMVFLRTNKEALGLDVKGGSASLAGQTTLISQAILQDTRLQGWDFEPSGNGLSTLQGGGAPITKDQQTAARNENAVPQTVNTLMLGLYEHLNRSGLLDLFANGEILPETMNENDRKSKEGQNLAIVGAFDTAMGLIGQIRDEADARKVAFEDQAIYREYNFSSVNRLQQQGQYGDQSSKLTRELITPYKATLDLTDPKQYQMWRRAIAQALGIKVEKKRPAKWEAELDVLLKTEAVQSAIDLMLDPSATPPDQLVTVLKDALDPTRKKGVSVVAVHALSSLAQERALTDRSSFTTHMYVEADGVTDGPTNSLFYMRLGGFDLKMIEGLMRGGFTFSKTAQALHQIFDRDDGKEFPDTYELTANKLAANLRSHVRNVINLAGEQKVEVREQADALFTVMNSLLGSEGFAYEDGKYIIGRKQLKNPLTVTVYGSSPSGIADKIAHGIVKELYSRISEANAADGDWASNLIDGIPDPQFIEALIKLGQSNVYQYTPKGRDDSVKITGIKKNTNVVVHNYDSAEKFTLSREALVNISSALNVFYVTPMVEAIEDGMGSAVTGSKVVQQATNMMSQLAKKAFLKIMQEELAKQKSFKEGLSPDELQKILNKVAFLFPYMEDDSITVNVKGLKKAFMDDDPGNTNKESAVRPASSFSGDAHVKLSVPMPAEAGVAGAAYVNISYGDGRMIIKASPNLVGGRLMVFDGINLALDNAARNGKAINQAVLEAIQSGTPFSDLNRNYQQMMEIIDPTLIFDETREIGDALSEAALDEKARQAVLRRVHISSDHMAALGEPASTDQDNERVDLGGMSLQDQANLLDKMYQEERKKLADKRQEQKQQAPSEDLSQALQALPKSEAGVREVSTDRLKSLVQSLNIPGAQRAIINRALLALNGSPWTVIFATQDEANAYAEANNIPYQFAEGDRGLAVPDQKTLIITNQSSETLAHELVHAATLDRVSAYYADPSSLDQVSRDAIVRLEALMLEWLDSAYEKASLTNSAIRDDVTTLTRVLTNLINQNKPDEALNEFMAWNLTNQNLIKINKASRVETKLARIKRDVINVLRKLFGLPAVNNDMDSNIRFNSMVLMSKGLPPVEQRAANKLLQQSTNFRDDLKEIGIGFANMIGTADARFEKEVGIKRAGFALANAYKIADIVRQQGFNLTNEELTAFTQVVAAFRIDAVGNSADHAKMDAYYREVMAQMNQDNMMDDPTSQNPGDQIIASNRLDLLRGNIDLGTDTGNRTMLLPTIVALAATSAQAQKLLNRIQVRNPKAAAKGTNVDAWLKSQFGKASDRILKSNFDVKPNVKIADGMSSLVREVIDRQQKDESKVQKYLEAPSNLVLELNEKTTDVVSDSVDKLNEGMDYLAKQLQGTPAEKAVNIGKKYISASVGIISKRHVAESTDKFTSMVNQTDMLQEFRALIAELMGVNEGNVDILSLVKIAKASIHKVRQTYRDGTVSAMAAKFSRALDQTEWAAIYKGLGKTDISVLIGQGLTATGIVDLISNPTALINLKNQKEADIRKLFGTDANAILSDANDLVTLMSTGRPPNVRTKRNALAIVNKVGSGNVGTLDTSSPEYQAVDAYVSLVTLSQLDPATMKTLSGLAANDSAGLAYALSQINHARQTEQDRVPHHLRFNTFKGYMPFERQGSFKIVTRQGLNAMTTTGYRVVGSRQAGTAEALYTAGNQELFYVVTDIPPPAFKQGIMQTVRSTVFGLDAATGLQHDNPTGGLILDPTAVARITAAGSRSGKPELLAPIYNADGKLYAYERLADPAIVRSSLETQENAAVATGQWMGRQHEELAATELNNVLISRLTNMWDAEKNRSPEEFIDLFEAAKTNPVIAYSVNLLSDKDKEQIKQSMGDKFMVRKDMYEQVIGYPSMNLGDLFTGTTNMTEEARQSMANFLTGLLGPEAYKKLVTTENAWSGLMSDARVAVVVKSVIVPMINGIANFFQLMANGINPVDIATISSRKLKETHLYAQNVLKYQQLEHDLASAKGQNRPDRIRLIETEMRKIEDLNKRLSIWPLIQAGEFSQVTEGLSQDDLSMTRGNLWEAVSKWADKLPPAVKTAGRYVVVAKDTALFEGLARTVAYTDFVAKAVLYEHLTTKRKLDQKAAYLRITNEFVNYDLLGGRTRSKAEEMGLIWFWAFKIRAIKVAMSMIRNNPVHAMLTGFVPGIEATGTVIDDNMASLIIDDRFWNTVGPDNALRAIHLNPWAQVL